jgi:hypothetical protein
VLLQNLGRTLLLLLLVAGCRRERGHSKAFDDASALFRKVYAEKLDDAFDDPRMQEVERLLSVVPPQSIDSPAAQELQQRITAGRAALAAEREAAAAPEAQAPPPDPWARTPEPPPPPQPNAGPPHPVPGMTVEELKRRFAGCFSFRHNGALPDKTRHDIWGMADTAACRKAHPEQADQLLVIDAEGKTIMGYVPATAMQVRYLYPDGGEAPPPKPKP